MTGLSGSSVAGLIARARHDSRAADDLLVSYRTYLRFIARDGIGVGLRSKVDASDIAQDIVMRARERFDQFRGTTEAELLSWLRKMLARHLIDLVRRYRLGGGREVVHERSIQQELYESSQSMGRVVAFSGTSPSRQAARRESVRRIADALLALKPDHAEVIRLRTMRGLGWAEVAERMDRSYDAARLLWLRAVEALRPQLEDDG
ncbi:MAG: sigma-70 family RNA polymerase sigma factor [Planctomycetota bacterium]|jgi:RNA polymerase sigma-70 factor (ECF subfamily)